MKVGLQGCSVYCILGCDRLERELPQEITLDIEYTLYDEKIPEVDNILHTVDYVEVLSLVSQRLQSSKFYLLETAARDVSHAVLATFPSLLSCTLCLRKSRPAPFITQSYVEYCATRKE